MTVSVRARRSRLCSFASHAWTLSWVGSLCRVIDDVDTWHRLAALLPPDQAHEFNNCWAIGEQEAGLGLFVAGILSSDVAISETVRAGSRCLRRRGVKEKDSRSESANAAATASQSPL